MYSKEFYERTIITDWDLVCSNVKEKSVYRSVYFVSFFAVFTIGILGDRFGRKNIIYILVTANALVFLTQAVALNLITSKEVSKSIYGVTRFLVGFTSGVYGLALVLCMELVGPSYRSTANNFMFYFFILGEFIVLFFSYFIPDYRECSIYIAVLVSLLVAYFWWIPESVRYLIGRKQYDKADAVFKRIAKSNNKVFAHIWDVLFKTRLNMI